MSDSSHGFIRGFPRIIIMIENDIPIEGVLKYIKRERDKYKDKLETLVPYTKSLENKLKELTARNLTLEGALKDYDDQKKLTKRISVLEQEKEMLIKENSALIKDFKQTDWYKQLKDGKKKLRNENKMLKQALNRFLTGDNKFNIDFDLDD